MRKNGKKPGKAPAFSHDDMFSGESGIKQTTAVYEGPDDKDVGEATLYVTPVADTPQRFYKVEAK